MSSNSWFKTVRNPVTGGLQVKDTRDANPYPPFLGQMPKRYRSGATRRRRGTGGGSGGKRSKNTYGGRPYVGTRYYAGGGNGLRTGGMIGAEVKFLDMGNSQVLPTAGSTVNSEVSPTQSIYNGSSSDAAFGHLTPIPQGNGPHDRNGRACVLKRITIRGLLQVPAFKIAADTQPANHTVRVMLVKDTQTNQSTGTGNVVTAGVLAPGVPNAPIVGLHRDLEHQKRFHILYDRTFVLKPSGTAYLDSGNSATNCPALSIPFTIDKAMRLPLTFKGGVLGVVTDEPKEVTNNKLETNSLHLYAWTSTSAVSGSITHDADDRVYIKYSCRIRWVG